MSVKKNVANEGAGYFLRVKEWFSSKLKERYLLKIIKNGEVEAVRTFLGQELTGWIREAISNNIRRGDMNTNRTITTLLILLALALFAGCSRKNEQTQPNKSSGAAKTDEPAKEKPAAEAIRLLPVKQDSKWGYIDAKGTLVIAPQYGEAKPFSEGLAAVRVGKLWGYADQGGKLVIQPQYKEALDFSEGSALVVLDGKDWKSGYIDPTGKFVINPQFHYGGPFSEGLAFVVLKPRRISVASPLVWTGSGYIAGSPTERSVQPGEFSYVDKSGKILLEKPVTDSNKTSQQINSLHDLESCSGGSFFITKRRRVKGSKKSKNTNR